MKMLNLSDEYSQINYISSKFSNIANNINSLDTSDDELLEIIVYAEKNELVQTSIKIKQEKLIKIVNDKENNKINIKQEILKENLKDKFILSISDVLNKILSQIEEIEISNETKNENTVQKPCSNTSKSGANVDKSRGSGKRMNMSPILDRYFI